MDFQIWWVFAFVTSIIGIQTVGRIAVAMIERRKSAPPQQLNELSEKVDRIAQAIEATALEVERIGESQRFLTRVLGDGHAASHQRSDAPGES